MDSKNQNPRCNRCGKNTIINDFETDEQFCQSCGFVCSEKSVESGPEFVKASSPGESNAARTGAPSTLLRHDFGLSTVISPVNRDFSGQPLSTTMKSSLERLRTWDGRSMKKNNQDINLLKALAELTRLNDKLSLSNSVSEYASYIYRKALEKNLIRGRSINAMIAASLYAACRFTLTSRTLKEVASTANIKPKDVSKSYRTLCVELDLKMPPMNPILCISRIASRLNMSEKIKRDAGRIIKTAQDNYEVSGKDPMGLAATALYIASIKNGKSITQIDLASASGVTEVTIRNRLKLLKVQENSKEKDF